MKHSPTPVVFSLDDRLKAFYRHQEFQRYSKLWLEIFRKLQDGAPFTDEEDALFSGRVKRNEFNLEAERQAARFKDGEFPWQRQEQWRERCATSWAVRKSGITRAPTADREKRTLMIDLPIDKSTKDLKRMAGLLARTGQVICPPQRGRLAPLDRHAFKPHWDLRTRLLTVTLPLDYPPVDIEKIVGEIIRACKDFLRVTVEQEIKRPEVDPWLVCDLKHDHDRERNLLEVTRRLFKNLPNEPHTLNDEVRRAYERVKRAYYFAQRAIEQVGLEHA